MCDRYVVKKLEKNALKIRLNLLKLCSMQSIHIGGDLSSTDVMTVLWQYQMKFNPQNPNDDNRDRFVLSKSHASAVTSFNQALLGCFDEKTIFDEYATDEGRFSMHSCGLINRYVEVSTGSLGHGMPIACGMAAALKRRDNKISRVYTLMGDGEQSEGSIWEAALNAVHYKLGNLVAIIDYNKFEADGRIDSITGLGNIATKYREFGWNVVEVEGNNVSQLIDAFDNVPDADTEVPSVIVCHTIKGCGVDFMENNAMWHAGRITQEQYQVAASALIERFCVKWGQYE